MLDSRVLRVKFFFSVNGRTEPFDSTHIIALEPFARLRGQEQHSLMLLPLRIDQLLQDGAAVEHSPRKSNLELVELQPRRDVGDVARELVHAPGDGALVNESHKIFHDVNYLVIGFYCINEMKQ